MNSFQLAFEAIGTHWVIDCYHSDLSKKEQVLSLIVKRIEDFDKTYSRFRRDSLVWKISKKKGEYLFPKDSHKFFSLYDQFYKITDGKFTLLIGNSLDEAGYDADYSLVPRKMHKVPDVNSVYSFDYPTLSIKKPYILDFGGLGKGYLIDILADLLIEQGLNSFCINGGGDILYKGLDKPLRVGLENPNNFKEVIGIAKIVDQSIAASSSSRRKWSNFHHIINPHTLESPMDILSTWVVAKDGLIADAIATCLFLVSREKLEKYFKFESIILYSDFSVSKSKNFPGELFTKKIVQ